MSNKLLSTTLDRQIKSIQSEKKALDDQRTQVNSLVEQLPVVAQQLEDAQEKLDLLAKEYAVKVDEEKYQFSLKVRDNKEKVLADLLKEFGLGQISISDLNSLRQDLAVANEDKDDAVVDAVNKVVKELKQAHELELIKIKSDNSVQSSETKHKISALESQVEVLQGQLDVALEREQAIRDAEIKKAQAEAGRQGVVVNTNK